MNCRSLLTILITLRFIQPLSGAGQEAGGMLSPGSESELVRLARETRMRQQAKKKFSNATLAELQAAHVTFTTRWTPPAMQTASPDPPRTTLSSSQLMAPAAEKKKDEEKKSEKQEKQKSTQRKSRRAHFPQRPDLYPKGNGGAEAGPATRVLPELRVPSVHIRR